MKASTARFEPTQRQTTPQYETCLNSAKHTHDEVGDTPELGPWSLRARIPRSLASRGCGFSLSELILGVRETAGGFSCLRFRRSHGRRYSEQ